MIRTKTEPTGWYGDCNVEGDNVSLYIGSHVSVNGNRIELPINNRDEKENVLFLIMQRWNLEILLAGQGQVGDRGSGTWLYKNNKWNLIAGSFGTYPVAFSNHSLYLVTGNNQYKVYDLASDTITETIPRQIGSGGIRYIDFSQSIDGIVTGDETYGPAPYNLSQWILRSPVVLGQSYIDGCIALLDNIRYKIESGSCQFLRFYIKDNRVAITIVNQPENKTIFYWMNVEDIKTFPVDVIPEVIGPRTKPRVDNKKYDLLRFILGKSIYWPRKGPQHPMAQSVMGNIFHFVKFSNPEAYETWAYDTNWIYHLEDASSEPYHFSDPRWFPRYMQIGEVNCFSTDEHEIIFTKRYACNIWRRDPLVRRMWLHAVYDEYYWGPNLAIKPTIAVVYDPASRINSHGVRVGVPGRNIELGYYSFEAGSCRWDSYPSTKVYKNNDSKAVFDEADIEFRSDFYLLGDVALQPKLTTCVKQIVPSYPPWHTPIPEPIFKEIVELKLMEPEIVSLVAFDHYARVLDGKVVFDQTTESEDTKFEISKPDDRFAIKKNDKYVGVDSTIFSPDIRNQYYMTNDRGNYESFFIGTTPNGLLVAFVEYIHQGANNTVPFISVPITIKRS